MPKAETVVPEGAVHELLGLKRLPREHGVNISILNAVGRRWLDRDDVLTWLRMNAEATDSQLLAKLERELSEITAGGS